MTPAARINAAIELMDRIQSGELADRALANWGRRNRYAGAKDRAAIGDIVYDVLRKKQGCATYGQGQSGRALLLGHLRASGENPDNYFGKDRYAPSELTETERRFQHEMVSEALAASRDFPDWLWPDLVRSHPAEASEIARCLLHRAPVFLRVNLMKSTRDDVIKSLADNGIKCRPHALSLSAIQVDEGARLIRNCGAFQKGAVELQDAASQAVADMVPLQSTETFLDFCAGGGGKVLAVAGRVSGVFFAHDVDPQRMKDLPKRASRAGVQVRQVSVDTHTKNQVFDTVLVDAPCSGSGAWRRDPQGKWALTPEKLANVVGAQRHILKKAASLVRQNGYLVYATCSLLDVENQQQTKSFLKDNTDFCLNAERHFTPLMGGDGFYCVVLRRK
jgi:16S rRNA (cytosine967-C5)-methyltransferase